MLDASITISQDRQYAVELRATLIQEAKALEQQRNAILMRIAILERKYKIGKNHNLGETKP